MKTKLLIAIAFITAASALAKPGPSFRIIVEDAAISVEKRTVDPATALRNAFMKRIDWNPTDIYVLYKAVVKGAGLDETLKNDLEYFRKNVNNDLPGVKLLKVLQQQCSSLPSGTFEMVMAQLVMDVNGISPQPEGRMFEGPNTNMPTVPSRDKRPFPVPVTRDPISPQN